MAQWWNLVRSFGGHFKGDNPSSRIVLLADAQELDQVLTKATNSRAMDQRLSQLDSEPFFLNEDEKWKKHRRVSAPLMGSKHLRQMTPAIAENAQILVNLWKAKMKAKANGATCFSCEDDFKYATLDAILSATTGKSAAAVENAISEIARSDPVVDEHGGATFHLRSLPICDAVTYLFRSIGDTVSLPPTLTYIYQQYLRWTPTFNKHYRIAADTVNQSIAEHRQRTREARALGEKIEANSLIEMIVQNEGQPDKESFSEAELRDEALGFVFGVGPRDGGGGSAMGFLTETPEIQRALRQELLGVVASDGSEGRPVTFDEMMSPEKTPYLEAVVAETLRLSIVAGGSTRQATQQIDFLGHTIPAGTNIVYLSGLACFNASVENEERLRSFDSKRTEMLQKNEAGGRELWKMPTNKFEPERWIKVDSATGKKTFDPKAGFSFPFGFGLRACPGKQLAMLELKIYIATLNLAFFLDRTPQELSSHRAGMKLSRFPLQAYVSPKPWSSASAMSS
ncbi:hypothetical protein FS837_009106 [Tulasnella sp. UAMH 9824]|nr:hypothetical protein FS837_009106 [Tulasnella sp. UAMH 9824]